MVTGTFLVRGGGRGSLEPLRLQRTKRKNVGKVEGKEGGTAYHEARTLAFISCTTSDQQQGEKNGGKIREKSERASMFTPLKHRSNSKGGGGEDRCVFPLQT